MPKVIPYPRREVNEYLLRRFNSEADYFTSSISYMIALAMYEKFKEIRIYGVDFSLTAELAFERPGCEYLIGLARGSGIRIALSQDSPLLYTPYTYGYDEPRMTIPQARRTLGVLSDKGKTNTAKMKAFRAGHGNKLGQYVGSTIRRVSAYVAWLNAYSTRGFLLKKDGSVN